MQSSRNTPGGEGGVGQSVAKICISSRIGVSSTSIDTSSATVTYYYPGAQIQPAGLIVAPTGGRFEMAVGM
jgi:hypothetical protein